MSTSTPAEISATRPGPATVRILIDRKPYTLPSSTTTPRALLVDFAKVDPMQTTLTRRHGNKVEKFDDPDVTIEVKNGDQFAVLHQAPTPVS